MPLECRGNVRGHTLASALIILTDVAKLLFGVALFVASSGHWFGRRFHANTVVRFVAGLLAVVLTYMAFEPIFHLWRIESLFSAGTTTPLSLKTGGSNFEKFAEPRVFQVVPPDGVSEIHIMSRPKANSPVISSLREGDTITALGRLEDGNRDWLLLTNHQGYVDQDYLVPTTRADLEFRLAFLKLPNFHGALVGSMIPPAGPNISLEEIASGMYDALTISGPVMYNVSLHWLNSDTSRQWSYKFEITDAKFDAHNCTLSYRMHSELSSSRNASEQHDDDKIVHLKDVTAAYVVTGYSRTLEGYQGQKVTLQETPPSYWVTLTGGDANYQFGYSDQETALKVAGILVRAVKLCGGYIPY